ncbi:protein FRA10AC1 [Senna tora]|uniref:Protein FRA10AC1 n=1 Tax=Senna tora TaxID=362788 RepID=A0A834X0Y0_9FABA|nr:protein FRA10AC1 [Senna tora]
MTSLGSLKSAIFEREERKQQYQAHIRGLNAFDRHKKFLNDYVRFYGKEKPSNSNLPIKTDKDTLREGYRFIRSEEDDMNPSWEQRLVKRYYDKLFKEYCIADMSHYKSGKIGLRWRTEKEVISGKGQFICGNKHCDEKDGLASYEVNFCYSEAGENKQALVKLVICERCADKLHYKRRKEKEKLEKREQEGSRKRNRSKSVDEDEFNERKERRRKDVARFLILCSEKNSVESDYALTRKGASISPSDHKADDGDSFDEFLEGMFL